MVITRSNCNTAKQASSPSKHRPANNSMSDKADEGTENLVEACEALDKIAAMRERKRQNIEDEHKNSTGVLFTASSTSAAATNENVASSSAQKRIGRDSSVLADSGAAVASTSPHEENKGEIITLRPGQRIGYLKDPRRLRSYSASFITKIESANDMGVVITTDKGHTLNWQTGVYVIGNNGIRSKKCYKQLLASPRNPANETASSASPSIHNAPSKSEVPSATPITWKNNTGALAVPTASPSITSVATLNDTDKEENGEQGKRGSRKHARAIYSDLTQVKPSKMGRKAGTKTTNHATTNEEDDITKRMQEIELFFRNKLARVKEQENALKIATQEKDQALKARDQAVQEKDRAIKDRDDAIKERQISDGKRDQATQEKDQALKERNRAIQDKCKAVTERDRAVKEKQISDGERDQAVTDKIAAEKEKDKVVKERDDIIRRSECFICSEYGNAFHAFIPCGHMVCSSCVDAYVLDTPCPKCQVKIMGRLPLFN